MEWVLTIIFFIGVAIYFYSKKKQGDQIKDDLESSIAIIENEPLRIAPRLKQSLNEFSVQNARQLRQMEAEELQNMLSLSAQVLKVFEDQIALISEGYEKIEAYVETGTTPLNKVNPLGSLTEKVPILSEAHNKPTHKEEVFRSRMNPLKEKLDTQTARAAIAMQEEMDSVGAALNIIPEKYRMSLILEQFCSYLADGECDSWEGCVKAFKDDVRHMQTQESFQAVIGRLDLIERNTAATAQNTAAIAYFSGIAMWR